MLEHLRPARLWALAKHAVVFELRLYRSLARWLARRPDRGSAGDEVVGYGRTVTPVMWLWIFASAAELPLVHVLVPWETVRLVLLVTGVWGLVWMVGLLASYHVYPHLLGPEVARVRNGVNHRITLPWSAVAAVRTERRDLDSSVWALQPREDDASGTLQIVVSGQVNVHLRLHEPTTVDTARGPREIVELSFFADEPRDAVAAVRRRLVAARG
jgi:hypothetical protein